MLKPARLRKKKMLKKRAGKDRRARNKLKRKA